MAEFKAHMCDEVWQIIASYVSSDDKNDVAKQLCELFETYEINIEDAEELFEAANPVIEDEDEEDDGPDELNFNYTGEWPDEAEEEEPA